jgi:hypothetical protein
LLAVSFAALSAGVAHAQQPGDLDVLAQQILDNPQDVALNLRYAQAAEALGKPRLALVAYERILINDPSNQEARRGYERVRRTLEPGYTVARLETGVRWDSNPHDINPDFSFFFFGEPQEGTTYYGKLMVANEHAFGATRFRTTLNLEADETPDIPDIRYEYIGLQTGPLLYLGPHIAALPAIGVSSSWVAGDHYYDEVNASFGMEGRAGGSSYWWRLRGGHRDYDHDTPFFFSGPIAEDGNYYEFTAGYLRPRTFGERGTLSIAPFARWSDMKGDTFDFFIFDDLSPGKYLEYGADVNYDYQLGDHVEASIGTLARKRDFRDSSRADMYLSPQASVTLQRIFPCNCDLRFQYRYRNNDTNDDLYDYRANQFSLALTTRF